MKKKNPLQFARPLLDAAFKNGAEERVLQDIQNFGVLFLDSVFHETLIKISALPFEKIIFLFRAAFQDSFHPLTLNFFIILAASRNMDIFSKILEQYKNLYFTKKNISRIVLVTAKKLDQETREHYILQLKNIKKQELFVEFEEDSRLVGGCQLYEGSRLFDYSVSNFLDYLTKALLKHNFS